MAPTSKPVNALFRFLNLFHASVLRLTHGKIGRRAFGMSVVQLHTVGRVSGKPRDTLLTVPVQMGETLILVASKGGNDLNPDWFKNAVAHPDVEVTLDGVRKPMHARVMTPQEKTELWPRVCAAYKPYEFYQRRSKRDVPLLACEPRS